jgi:hypothetical protein
MKTYALTRSPRFWTVLLAALMLAWSAVPAVQAQVAPSRTYTPGAFDEVEIHGSALVRLTQGAVDQVVVEGDEDLQGEVRLDVRDGRLNVRQSGSWKFWSTRRLRLSVTLRDLKRLSISGAADVLAPQPMKLGKVLIDVSGSGLVRFDKLQAQELRFSVFGAGDGQFAGAVEQLAVTVSGKSDFRGEDLRTQVGRIAVSGLGDIRVWAERELAIGISGVGRVDYWGSPELTRRTPGLATISARGAKAAAP